MNNQKNQEKDILKEYIDPERIEKAPDGFSLKTMARVHIEAGTGPERERFLIRNLVPAVAGLITIILIALVILLPDTNGTSLIRTIVEKTGIAGVSFPQFDIDLLTGFSIPSIVSYLLIGIFMLLLFDRVLSLFFHRNRDNLTSLFF